ncbi:hypothetical protein BKA67DRAFT_686661 [Truncatella angustata]|uniref:Uncharacterized protein n=1 Tax=Truncatella angustata TaxID=152316 RepID=A0A9P9A394_9PEZI|nr:uncharacterized protein BKA67DRAFT_686661 [Truncatella angustata]KAH6660227.1 hypothetical protein BKA67DRAFT_686661 [Truncatella angustata]KAH8199907.1 hypothetical protein TruAng_005903 [Truncatella angustata]
MSLPRQIVKISEVQDALSDILDATATRKNKHRLDGRAWNGYCRVKQRADQLSQVEEFTEEAGTTAAAWILAIEVAKSKPLDREDPTWLVLSSLAVIIVASRKQALLTHDPCHDQARTKQFWDILKAALASQTSLYGLERAMWPHQAIDVPNHGKQTL